MRSTAIRSDTMVPALRAALACAALALPAMAHGEGEPPGAPATTACPGADTWNREHPGESPEAIARRDAARGFANPELRAQLQERVDADQRARTAYLASPHDPEVRRRVLEVDSENLAWLRILVADKGIPTAADVGESGVKWAWLLVQHADRDPRLQASVLGTFVKRYEAGELPADDLARLNDRVLLALGRPQRFGTQFDWLSGHFEPRGGGDAAQFDANRRKFGLMPLADYACMMNARLGH